MSGDLYQPLYEDKNGIVKITNETNQLDLSGSLIIDNNLFFSNF